MATAMGWRVRLCRKRYSAARRPRHHTVSVSQGYSSEQGSKGAGERDR
jgi:hypothetical protein